MYVKCVCKTVFWVFIKRNYQGLYGYIFSLVIRKNIKLSSNYLEMIKYHFSDYILYSQPDKHCLSMIRKYLVVFKNYILQYVNQTELDIVWGFMLENNDDYVLYIAVVWISNDNFTISHYKICQMEFCNLS